MFKIQNKINSFYYRARSQERDSNRSAKRTPVPTPRKVAADPFSGKRHTLSVQNLNLHSRNYLSPDFHGSSSSLAMSDGTSTTTRRRKHRAPPPPPLMNGMQQLSSSNKSSKADNLDYESEESTSSKGITTSTNSTPLKSSGNKGKKRRAPPPPSSVTPSPAKPGTPDDSSIVTDSGIDQSIESLSHNSLGCKQKLIPLGEELTDDKIDENASIISDSTEVTYRRQIIPMTDPVQRENTMNVQSGNFTFQESTPDSKRESKDSQGEETIYLNKSDKGKWKRRKGPAPALPMEVRKSIKTMSSEAIKQELEVIEVQQLGLEKQGVMLEKIIREKCEGVDAEKTQMNPKAVEDLIMQLFDVVNEKNELFRRQAELMYM